MFIRKKEKQMFYPYNKEKGIPTISTEWEWDNCLLLHELAVELEQRLKEYFSRYSTWKLYIKVKLLKKTIAEENSEWKLPYQMAKSKAHTY